MSHVFVDFFSKRYELFMLKSKHLHVYNYSIFLFLTSVVHFLDIHVLLLDWKALNLKVVKFCHYHLALPDKHYKESVNVNYNSQDAFH